jgi:hypothetical protein
MYKPTLRDWLVLLLAMWLAALAIIQALSTPRTSTPCPSAYTLAVLPDNRTVVLLNGTDANACSIVAHNLPVSRRLGLHNHYSAPLPRNHGGVW